MAVSRISPRVLVAFLAVTTLHGDTKKLSQDQRVELLRGLSSEYATAKIILPNSRKALPFEENGTWDKKTWEEAVRKDGPAARAGDKVQVTKVDVEDDADEGEVVASRSPSSPGEEVRVAIPDDPTILSHLLSGIIQVDQPRRQELLEAATTVERIEELLRLIEREIALLERRLRNYSVDPRQAAIRRN